MAVSGILIGWRYIGDSLDMSMYHTPGFTNCMYSRGTWSYCSWFPTIYVFACSCGITCDGSFPSCCETPLEDKTCVGI